MHFYTNVVGTLPSRKQPGSDRGGERAAAMYTLIATAKLNDIDTQAWLADVLGHIAALPHARVHELLPWDWKAARDQTPPA